MKTLGSRGHGDQHVGVGVGLSLNGRGGAGEAGARWPSPTSRFFGDVKFFHFF